MIISEFYDDFQTFENTTTEEQVILTDTVLNLNVNTADIDKAYLMGYVDPDYIPQITHVSRVDVVSTSEADYVEFVDVTDKKNIPWMYTAGANPTGSYSGNITDKVAYYHANDTDGWVLGGYYTSGRLFMKFINSLKISNVASRAYLIEFKAYTVNHTDSTINNYWTVGNPSISFTDTTEFLSWLKGETEKTITLQIRSSGSPTNKDFTVKGTDFANGEFSVEYSDEIGDYTTYIYILAVFTNEQRIVWNSGSLGSYPNVSVTYHHTSQSEGIEWLYKLGGRCGARFPTVTSGDSNFVGLTISNLFNGTWSIAGQTFVNNDKTYVFGGITGRIPYRWAMESAYGSVIKNNRTLFHKYTSSQIRAYVFWLTSDIERWVQQLIRLELTSTLEYGFSDNVGVPKYNTDNSPAWQILTGDFETIEDDLRPWQIDDIKYNPFTIDDVPPYIPPGPTPPEDEESGDRIPNNERYFSGAYNFITQYAMTRQQLGQFGNLLWTSWADQQGITDMWKNFKMFISSDPASDTGSIDIASVMDFILSLQVFPFDLSSLLHTDSSNVCIGTGQYPLAVSGKKLLTINHILDCGTMAIPRPYNDFRDYENMSITAYLPYCGSVELNPGDVVGRSVSIEYSVDTLSGSCTAVLTAYDDDGYLYNVGMINGQISASIPMTATNSGQIRAQRISDVASLAGLAGNTFLGNITQGSSISPSGVDSNPIGAISSLATGTVGRSFNSAISAQQMFANRFSRGAISCPTLAGGNGIAAFYQPACPYIQMRYGLYQKPANYDHSVGEVSASSNPLSAYAGSGFTVCENVDISGFTCHEEERSAIKALLESGVYL